SVGRPWITTSHGPTTRSMTVSPGSAPPAANLARRFSTARSLSNRSNVHLRSAQSKLPAQVLRFRRGALHFPAGGAADAAGRHERDVVDVEPEQIADTAADRLADALDADGSPRLHEQHDTVRASRLGDAERH